MRTIIATLGASCLSVIFATHTLFGNPLGGVVVGGNGNATIAGEGTSLVTINQHKARAIINWESFNINAGELTKFVQPSATAAILNRVHSANPSAIYGSLEGNGRVFVINPAGILVGASGVIDTRGFVASTFDISDRAFRSAANLTFSGSSTETIRNEGKIGALGGDIFLIAHKVENEGTLKASGTVGLAAGSHVLLAQSGAQRISVLAGSTTAGGQGTGVDNQGQIEAATAELKAAGGNIYALAINNGGAVRASTVINEGGRIFLRSEGGNIENSGTLIANSSRKVGGTVVVDGGHNEANPATVISTGTIEARSSGNQGGTVHLLGDHVGLFDHGRIDVSGKTGGGTALIGGDFQGRNPAIHNALKTVVAPDASIRADATTRGDGGKVVVWADESTSYFGSLSARGGSQAGNGGLAEVSGKQDLLFAGKADLGAARGDLGQLLLDPRDIEVDDSPGNATYAQVSSFTNTPGSDRVVDPATLRAVVGDVVLQANRNITFTDALSLTNSGQALTAQAGQSIFVNNNITTANGNVTLVANELTANGVVDDERGTQNAVIDMAAGITINSGTANTTLRIDTGATRTGNGNDSGDITVASISAGHILIQNSGLDSGSDILRAGPASLLTANSAALVVDGGGTQIGSSANPIRVNVSNLSASSGAGGAFFLSPSSGLTIGGETLGSLTGIRTTGGGDLEITAAGSIGSVEALSVSGNSTFTFTAANSDVVLGQANSLAQVTIATSGTGTVQNVVFRNTNSGAVFPTLSAAISNLSITFDNAGVTLPATTVSGNIDVSAGGGNISNSGAVAAGSNAVFTTTRNNDKIILTNGLSIGNSLALNTLGANGDATVSSAGSLNFGASQVGGNLSATSGGNIGQSGVVRVGGLGTFTVGDGSNVLLGTNGNVFVGGVSNRASSGGISLVEVFNGATNSSALFAVNSATNAFLVSPNSGVSFGSTTVRSNLSVVAGGNLTQVGIIDVGGNTALTLSIPGQSIQLDQQANNFAGSVTVTGTLATLALRNVNPGAVLPEGNFTFTNLALVFNNAAINLGWVTNVPGTLTLVAGGDITQSNAVTVGGSSRFEVANGANILLGTNGNIFAGGVSNSATSGSINTLELFNAAASVFTPFAVNSVTNVFLTMPNSGIQFGTTRVISNLTVAAGGSLTQSGIIDVGGDTALTVTGAGRSIQLDQQPNNFVGSLSVTGALVTLALRNTNSAAALPGGNFTFTNLTLVFNNSAIGLGWITNVPGNLSLVAGGNITQSNAVAVGGNSRFEVPDGANILLGTNGNIFAGGISNLATSGSINTLELFNAAANVFTPFAVNSITNLFLTMPNSGIQFGNTKVINDLRVLAGGNLTQNGIIDVGGDASFTVPTSGANLLLDQQPNNFAGSLTVTGAFTTLALRNTNAAAVLPDGNFNFTNLRLVYNNAPINLGSITNVPGSLSLVAGGDITQSNAVNVGGTSRFEVANGRNILLGTNGNVFAGGVSNVATTGSINTLQLFNAVASAFTPFSVSSVTNLHLTFPNSGIQFGATTVISNTAVVSGGAITQIAPISLGSATSLDAVGNITLNNANNDFGGRVTIIRGQAVDLADNNNLNVGGRSQSLNADAGGDLVLSGYSSTNALAAAADGNISQTAPLTVGTTTSLDAGGNITLNDPNNEFTGPVNVLRGQTVALVDTNSLTVGGTSHTLSATANAGSLTFAGYRATNSLNANATANIAQTGALRVGTTADFNAGGNITLNDPANDFVGLVTIANGLAVRLADANSLMVGGNSASLDAAANGGDLTLAGYRTTNLFIATATGNIAQTAPVIAGTTSTLSAGGNINLNNPNNDFVGAVTVANGQAVDLVDTNFLIVGGSSGSLSAAANGGDLTFTGYSTTGSLSGTSADDIVQTAALLVGSTANLDALGDIILNHAANNFGGKVTVQRGQTVNLVDVNTLTVGGTSDALDATAGGNLTFDGYTTTNTLRAFSSAAIAQTAPLKVGANTILDAVGNISLNNPNNDFVGGVQIEKGLAVTLVDTNTLGVGGSSGNLDATAAGGDLALSGYTTTLNLVGTASGNISQSDLLIIGTTTRLDAGGNITLNNPNNDFVGAVEIVKANNVTVVDRDNLTIQGTSSSLDAVATLGELQFDGYTTTNSLSGFAGGNISQTASVRVGTTTSLDAAGDIILNDPNNEFVGKVDIQNADIVSLIDATALTVGGQSFSLNATANGGNLTLDGYTTTATLSARASADILQTLPLLVGTTAALNAGGDINLNDPNNDFGGAVAVIGQTVTLVDANSLTVGGTSTNLDASANNGDLILAAYNASQDLTGTASGDISQTGPVVAGDKATLNAGGDILLGNPANAFGRVELNSTNGLNIRLGEGDNTLLSHVRASNASVVINSGGLISQESDATIQARELAANSATGVTLTNNNEIQNLAGIVTNAGNFSFTDPTGIVVTNVAGISGISATAPGSSVNLNSDQILISGARISAGDNAVHLQPTTDGIDLVLSGGPSTEFNYSGLTNVSAAVLRIGSSNFSGNILIGQSITLGDFTTLDYDPIASPELAALDDTTLSLITSGQISQATNSVAFIKVPRLNVIGSLVLLQNPDNDIYFLSGRLVGDPPVQGFQLDYVDDNNLDWFFDTPQPGSILDRLTSQYDGVQNPGQFQEIDGILGFSPLGQGRVSINPLRGSLHGEDLQRGFNLSVETPRTVQTMTSVDFDFKTEDVEKKIKQEFGPETIWSSFALLPFKKQINVEERYKAEATSKWLRSAMEFGGSTGGPQQGR